MENFDKLKKSISDLVPLNNNDWVHLIDFVEIQIIKKNEYFLKEGQICDSIGFINNGILIYYKLNKNADEITTDISFEGDWVTNNESRLNHSPSLISIKSIEDSELFVVKNYFNGTVYHIPYVDISPVIRIGIRYWCTY